MDLSSLIPKQPGALEAPLIDRHVGSAKRLSRKGFLMAGLLVLPAVAWLLFAPLSSAVLASGVVKVDINRALVQHMEGGTVRAVHVRDGQRVKAGDPLIELGDIAPQADQRRLMQRMLSERAGLARLEAEQARQQVLQFPAELQRAAAADEVVAEQLEKEQALFKARLQSLNSSTSLFGRQREHIQREMESLRAGMQSARESIEVQSRELELNRRMSREGLVSDVQVMQLEARISDYKGRLAQNSADLTRADQRLGEIDLRINQLQNEYRQQASDQLRVALLRIQEIEQELRKADDTSRRQVIKAPIDGEIINLKVHSPGTVLMPRDAVAEIVPTNPRLIVEAQIHTEDIMRVHQAQEADLRLTAFTYRTSKLAHGKVVYVGADRLERRDTGMPYYVVHIEVDPESVRGAVLDQSDAKLQAGMPVEVFILGDRRTPMKYLLDPITQVMRHAARER